MITKIIDLSKQFAGKLVATLVALTFVGATFLLWGDVGPSKKNVIAMVEDHPITDKELRNAARKVAADIRSRFKSADVNDLISKLDIGHIAFNNLVSDYIMEAAFYPFLDTVSDTEVKNTIYDKDEFKSDDSKFDPALYSKILSNANIQKSLYEESIRRDIAIKNVETLIKNSSYISDIEVRAAYMLENQKVSFVYSVIEPEDLIGRLDKSDQSLKEWYNNNGSKFEEPEKREFRLLSMNVDDISKKITPTDEQIKEYYENNIQNRDSDKEVKASHILIKVDKNADEKLVKAAEEKIDQIYKKARKGSDFASLANEFSEDSSAKNGGDLGYFKENVMVAEFEKVAFSLGVGEVSKPFRTDFGFHIIKVFDKRGFEPLSLDKNRIDIEAKAKKDLAIKLIKTKLEEISFKINKDNFSSFSNPDENIMINSDSITLEDDDKNRSSKKYPDSAIYSAVTRLDQKEISDLIKTNDGYGIVILDKIEKNHLPDIADIKSKVMEKYIEAESKKLAEKLSDEIANAVSKEKSLESILKEKQLKIQRTDFISQKEVKNKKIGMQSEKNDELQFPDLKSFSVSDNKAAKDNKKANSYIVYQIVGREKLAGGIDPDEEEKVRKNLIISRKSRFFSAIATALRNSAESKGKVIINPAN